MPSDLKLNETMQIVEIVHAGVLTTENLQKSTNDALALLADRNVKSVLIDASDLESVEDFTEVRDLPRQYAVGGLSRRVRIAVVSPKLPEAQLEAHFYERFCDNRGWTVQSFKARGEAVAWLTSERTS